VHGVLPGLLIQAGDPQTRQDNAEVAFVDVEALEIEKNDLRHLAGTVSMAHPRNDPTSRSEFFICLQEVTYFDGKYTVIGEVISGIKVVDAISQVPRNAKQSPLFPVRIRRISLETQAFLKAAKQFERQAFRGRGLSYWTEPPLVQRLGRLTGSPDRTTQWCPGPALHRF